MSHRHASTEARILSVTAPDDAILHLISPLGLAAAAGHAIVVDLDPTAPTYPGSQTVARLCSEGPRLEDLIPPRAGVAVLPNGGADPASAASLVDALCRTWPAVVLRVPARVPVAPLVPVRALIPGLPSPAPDEAAVHQALLPGAPRLPGVVLPPIGRSAVRRMLRGGRPSSRRWLAGWRRVWELPWA